MAILSLCAASPDRNEVILGVKHELSRAKLLESSGKREEAAAKVDAVINQLEEWKASLEAPEVEAAVEEPVEYDVVSAAPSGSGDGAVSAHLGCTDACCCAIRWSSMPR